MSFLQPTISKTTFVPPPIRQLCDGQLTYSFMAFPINFLPYATKSVYAFSRHDGSILYIGSAENLADRLKYHDRLGEARDKGATVLLVHTPTVRCYVGYLEAEKRLIYAYDPPMNVVFRPKS